MKTQPNEPAFARSEAGTEFTTTSHAQDGLTKREHFSSMAMQGLCQSVGDGTLSSALANTLAKEAVFMADALIEALNK